MYRCESHNCTWNQMKILSHDSVIQFRISHRWSESENFNLFFIRQIPTVHIFCRLLAVLIPLEIEPVPTVSKLLMGENTNYSILHTPQVTKIVVPYILPTEDWEATFEGNSDDHFRLGVALSRKHLRLYTKFYMSDIIIASPLGLRTIIGTKG